MKSLVTKPVASLLVLALSAAAFGLEEKVTYQVDRAKVCYGNPDAFSKPAVVKAVKVFEKIRAYKTIQEEGIKPDSARYFLLLREANEVFRQALGEVCRPDSIDLVGEVGSIRADGVVLPDLTERLLKAVEGK